MMSSFNKLKQVLNDSESNEVLLYVNKCDEFGLDPDFIGKKFSHALSGELFTLIGMKNMTSTGSSPRLIVESASNPDLRWFITMKEFKRFYKISEDGQIGKVEISK